jgi:lipopolysaccharide export system permease protein
MIGTFDRYIIGKYLSTFFFAVLIFSLISMAIDFSDKVKNFIESECTLKNILVDYYPGFVLYISGLILPMYTLIAVVFFTSRLAFNSEILSVFNAGASFGRLLRPYLIAASVVAVLHLFMGHYLIPKMNQSRLWFERTFVWKDKLQVRAGNLHYFVDDSTKAYIRGYDRGSQRISSMRLQRLRDNKVVSILDADNVSWNKERQKWQMASHAVRQFDGLKERYQKVGTPTDTVFNLVPDDFSYYVNQNEEMTTWAILNAIEVDRNRGLTNTRQFSVELARRTADAFTNIILTVIAVAVAGRKVRGGMGLHLAIGIAIGAILVVMQKFAVSFATSGSIPIWLGMWIPNIVFTAVAIVLVLRAQK